MHGLHFFQIDDCGTESLRELFPCDIFVVTNSAHLPGDRERSIDMSVTARDHCYFCVNHHLLADAHLKVCKSDPIIIVMEGLGSF